MIVGLLAGNGYLFWAGRRSEIISALVAVSTLGEELRFLPGESAITASEPERGRPALAQLAAVWDGQRAALVPVMDPEDLQSLSRALPLHASSDPHDLEDLVDWVDGITRVLWNDLQSIIFTSFVRRRSTRQRSLVTQISHQQHPEKRVKPRDRAVPAPADAANVARELGHDRRR